MLAFDPALHEFGKDVFFKLFESWGHQQILAWISQGKTPGGIATEMGVPPFMLQQYINERIPKASVMTARQAAAGVLIHDAMAALSRPVPSEGRKFIGEVQLARATAEFNRSLAERMAPGDYGPPPPMEPQKSPVPIVINLDRYERPPEFIPDRTVRVSYQIEADPVPQDEPVSVPRLPFGNAR